MTSAMTSAMTFSLDPVPSFRLDLTVWTLRRRVDNLVDRWDGQTYQRTVALEDDGAFTPLAGNPVRRSRYAAHARGPQ